MKKMFIGGMVILLSIVMLFVMLFILGNFIKNPSELMRATCLMVFNIGILTGIFIFLLGTIQKLKGKLKMNRMLIGGIIILLSVGILYIPGSGTEEMMWAYYLTFVTGTLIGIMIFVIGVIQKPKQKINK